MKKWLLSFAVFFTAVITFSGCSTSINNSITFQNLSGSDLSVNFRGSRIDIAAGKTSEVKNIPAGTYDYATIYTVPAGVTSVSTQGNFSGKVTVSGGTKVLFIYTSTLTSGIYTLYVTSSNSDSQSSTTTTTGP